MSVNKNNNISQNLTTFKDYFIDLDTFDFDISYRGGINFEKVGQKLKESKAEHFIVDISINGYSNKENFDFEINGEKWSDIKNIFEKGQEAQKNPEALTVKRAIRLLSKDTTKYIRSKNIETNLKKFGKNCPSEYAHLGGHFVIDEINAPQLIALWANFDSIRKTNIKESVVKILELRFGRKF